MDIAESHRLVDIRLVGLRLQRVSQEDHKIDIIVLDLSSHLLFPAKMTRQEFMDV